MKKRFTILATAVLAATLLSGCSSQGISSGKSVPAEQIAATAADSLEQKLGVRPEVDCGEEPVEVFDGNAIRCDVIDPPSQSIYGADVTVRYSEENDGFGVDVSVDQNPKSTPQM